MNLLSVENLHANLAGQEKETPILRGVNMEVNTGELHLILGLNGSGKSTFGKVLLGHPSYEQIKGTITFNESEISELATFERAQAGLFLSHQAPPAVEGVATKDLLRAANKSGKNKLSVFAFKKLLQENVKNSGLGKEFLTRNFNEGASGGERKKMEIASLLTLGAQLAFLDEIDSGLDVDALKIVSSGIQKFLDGGEKSVILVSHSSAILKYLNPTHVHIFCGGRIVKTGGIELAHEVHEKGYARVINCKGCR